ncbi:endonuclease NucS domain-containing protein [Methylophaga sp.]|uniref:endonuclease NucS domain-containing protein n=1 Tax=Methylophaga sp. TaxID=2024840 RepID=UPI003A8DD41C
MKSIRNYYRIFAGAKSMYAQQCFSEGFIGADWGMHVDLTGKLPDNWRDFNHEFIPVYLKANPDKSKVAAGLACGMLHTICKGMLQGDIVLCPDGQGMYRIGEVVSEYFYRPNENLQHRRKINWYDKGIDREDMSVPLKNSAGSIGTVSNLTKYADELEALLEGKQPATLIHTDDAVEDPSVFALEKHLEDFLVANWQSTELGKDYDIFSVDGELVGQQYPSDTGPIDILAISKDQKSLLVVELKRGRASDVVVGQIQRYMGYVKDELAEANQSVKGVIIALEDDLRLKRALSVTNNIDFYRYQVRFKLIG